tara:strand:- start:3003 stop:4307 length:1305 start_codon:yes stop_codon:yes gene_type:complete
MTEFNKVFCMAPWVHMNVNCNGDVYPCCMLPILETEEHDDTDKMLDGDGFNHDNPLEYIAGECDGSPREFKTGSLINQSMKEAWNSEEMKELRRNMIAGKRSSFCTTCYKEESVGAFSHRQGMNNNFGHHYKYVSETKEDGTFDRFNLIYWDFRLSNVCNFKCRMCGPGCSSAWEAEMRKEFDVKEPYPKIDMDMVRDNIEPLYDIVEECYFAGGEPMIMDHHYEILQELIKRGRTDVRIRYNTNFSTLTYKGINVLDLWEKFDDVNVMISIDGIGERGELVRNGFDWKRFKDNYAKFRERFPDKKLTVNYVVQALTVFHSMDAQKELYMMGAINEPDDFYCTLLHNPDFLSVCILDSETRKELGDKIKTHVKEFLIPTKSEDSINQYISVLKLLASEKRTDLIPNFKAYMKALDALRGEDTLKTFPELKRVLQ